MMYDILLGLSRLDQDDLDMIQDAVLWLRSLDDETTTICLHASERMLVRDETLHVRVQVRQVRQVRIAALDPVRLSG